MREVREGGHEECFGKGSPLRGVGQAVATQPPSQQPLLRNNGA